MSGLQQQSDSSGLLGRAMVVGFASTVALWVAWFVTHLPRLELAESVSLPVLLAVWLIAGAAAIAWTGRGQDAKVGLLGGVICALVSLLILGSKIVPAASAAGPAPGGTRESLPALPLVIAGFLALGAVIGVVSSLLARVFPMRVTQPRSLAQMGVVVSVGITPLLVVGGLVTSTNSGMAVPDWPNTYGSNMFLYPLGPRSEPGLYLEHSHRLFGSLIGLMSLVLAIWTTAVERRRWVQVLAWIVFALVCLQGGLGGLRVLLGDENAAADKPVWAMLHGVLAQLVFGTMVALAATLTPLFTSPTRLTFQPSTRRFKLFATGLTHALIIQLVFGAMYRHLRSSHALWSHIGFSVVVVLFAILAGFVAMSLARRGDGEELPAGPAAATPGLASTLHRLGLGLIVVVGLQFALGWAAFLAGGSERTAQTAHEEMVRTAHQANGAVLIALAALGFVWSRWVLRRSDRKPESAVASAA